jgi:hypothetical protein
MWSTALAEINTINYKLDISDRCSLYSWLETPLLGLDEVCIVIDDLDAF